MTNEKTAYMEWLDVVQQEPNSVVTVGTFDGVHVGHRAILDYLVRRAREVGSSSTVVTFDPHPREIVGSGVVALLTTIEERAASCREIGIDRFVVVPFTESFSKLTPREFVNDVLIERVGMREIVIGHDHHFGYGRSGNEELLAEMSRSVGFSVDVVPAQVMGNVVVSSSEIRRRLLEEGNVAGAATQLGYYYGLTATVVEGAGRGRTIGFPTANLQPTHPGKLIPANGVYAVRVRIDGESDFRVGMMNIGRRPTFEDSGRHLEVHIIDFDAPIYGRRLRVEFLERIRSERKFDNIEELSAQLRADRARCMALVGSESWKED